MKPKNYFDAKNDDFSFTLNTGSAFTYSAYQSVRAFTVSNMLAGDYLFQAVAGVTMQALSTSENNAVAKFGMFIDDVQVVDSHGAAVGFAIFQYVGNVGNIDRTPVSMMSRVTLTAASHKFEIKVALLGAVPNLTLYCRGSSLPGSEGLVMSVSEVR